MSRPTEFLKELRAQQEHVVRERERQDKIMEKQIEAAEMMARLHDLKEIAKLSVARKRERQRPQKQSWAG